jgi:hypothetical protein
MRAATAAKVMIAMAILFMLGAFGFFMAVCLGWWRPW